MSRDRRDTNQRRGRNGGIANVQVPLSLPHRRRRLQLPPSLPPYPSTSPHRTVMAGGTRSAPGRGQQSLYLSLSHPHLLPPPRPAGRGGRTGGSSVQARKRMLAAVPPAACVTVARYVAAPSHAASDGSLLPLGPPPPGVRGVAA